MYQAELENGRLSKEQLKAAVAQIERNAIRFQKLESYYRVEHPEILNRKLSDETVKDNKIAVGFPRKIVNTVTGFIFKPGLITYDSKEETLIDQIRLVLAQNNEKIKTTRLGKLTSIYGVAYEIHYVTGKGDPKAGVQAIPRFAIPDVASMLPVYSFDLEPELIAAVRYFKKQGNEYLEVYYTDQVETFRIIRQPQYDITPEGDPVVHYYNAVPVVVYKNNEELMGDFEPVLRLVDAYDVLVSDTLNELDRFANAYLVLKGLSMDEETAQEVKLKRMFEIMQENGSVEFLTKDVNDTFLEHVRKNLQDLIHEISQVPNLADEKFGGQQTGVSIRFKLADFENLAAVKEIYFRQGLDRRFELLSRIISLKTPRLRAGEITYSFARNIPANLEEIAAIVTSLRGSVSLKTLLGQVPFVDDPDAEIEALKKETPELTDPYFEQEDPEDDSAGVA